MKKCPSNRCNSIFAQEALALLAQLAHNLLSWFKGWVLGRTEAEKLGAERLIREVMAIPAEVRKVRRGASFAESGAAPSVGKSARPWRRSTLPPGRWRTISHKN